TRAAPNLSDHLTIKTQRSLIWRPRKRPLRNDPSKDVLREKQRERRLHAKVPAGVREPSREKQPEAKRSIRATNFRKRWQRESLSYGSRARTSAVIRFQRRNSSV